MIAAESPIFECPISVAPEDIDYLGHVNNSVYIKWAQKIAEDYWAATASAEMIAIRLWIAIEHNIRYHRSGLLGDRVVGRLVETSYRGARANFHLNIMRDETILATVKSIWCCIDRVSRRPAMVPAEIACLASREPVERGKSTTKREF